MAVVDPGVRQKLSSLNPPQGDIIPTTSNDTISYGEACRLTANGAVRSIGTDDVDGFALGNAGATEPISLLKGGQRMRYSTGLAVGTNLYLDTVTAGRLNTTQGAGANAKRVARVIEPNVIAVYERHETAGV